MPWNNITSPSLNLWVNMAQIAYMQIFFMDDKLWHVQFSTNGNDWMTHPRTFADPVSAQAFLDTFAAGLP